MNTKLRFYFVLIMLFVTNSLFSDGNELEFALFFSERTDDNNYSFISPISLSFDESGCFYILDFSSRIITKFNEKGAYLLKIGPEFYDNSKFRYPSSIQVVNGKILVNDGQWLIVFNPDGSFSKTTTIDHECGLLERKFFSEHSYITHLYSSDFNEKLIYHNSVDRKAEIIHSLDLTKYFNQVRGLKAYAVEDAYMEKLIYSVAGNDVLYYAVSNKFEICKYNKGNKKVIFSDSVIPKAVPNEVREKVENRIRNSEVPMISPVGEYYNIVQDFTVDINGNLLILTTESEGAFLYTISSSGEKISRYKCSGLEKPDLGNHIAVFRNDIFIFSDDEEKGLLIYKAKKK